MWNFCGPYRSDGSFQSSVCPKHKKPISEFDETCATHDCDLFHNNDIDSVMKADDRFYKDNYGKGVFRSIVAQSVKTFNPVFSMAPYGLPIGDLDFNGFVKPSSSTYIYPGDVKLNDRSSAYADWVRQMELEAKSASQGDTPAMVPAGDTQKSAKILKVSYSPFFPIKTPKGFRRRAYRQRKRKTLRK
jgi:hypothetical protein